MDLPDPYPGPSRPMLAAQLRRASEASHRFAFEYLREQGFSDLRQSHFDLFRFPGPHGQTPTQLAEHMGLSKQALNPLLNELQAMGYLTRGTTAGDRRTRILTLTPRGLDLVGAIRDALELLETRTTDQLGRQGYRTLLNALANIQALSTSSQPNRSVDHVAAAVTTERMACTPAANAGMANARQHDPESPPCRGSKVNGPVNSRFSAYATLQPHQ